MHDVQGMRACLGYAFASTHSKTGCILHVGIVTGTRLSLLCLAYPAQCPYNERNRNIFLGLMIIVCPHCGILYGVDQSLLIDDARTVRCSNCAWEWLHTRDAALPDTDETLRLLTLSIGGRRSSGHKADQESSPDLHAVGPAASPPPQRAEDGARVPEGDTSESSRTPAHEEADDAHQAPIPEDALTAEPPRMSLEDEAIEPERDSANDSDDHRESKPEIVTPPVYLRAIDREDVEVAPTPPAAGEASDVVIPPPVEDSEHRSAEGRSAQAPSRLRRPAIMAAAAIAASLLISVGLLAATRGAVTAAFPGAAHLYSAIGLSGTQGFADGLEIRDVSSTRSWNDGAQILTVAGDLANTAKKPRVLPMVRVVLVDGSDTEVQEVVIVPPGDTLPVGESVRFEAQISDPADTAARIKVSLAPRPESS